MERADDVVRGGIEFYIPHKTVVRENAQSTKMRIVNDTSARANASVPSLNECREIGPPLQNQLYNLFIRNRFYPVTIAGDLKQALLQIHVRSLTLSLVKRSGKQTRIKSGRSKTNARVVCSINRENRELRRLQ